jgi:hypothetical protein
VRDDEDYVGLSRDVGICYWSKSEGGEDKKEKAIL